MIIIVLLLLVWLSMIIKTLIIVKFVVISMMIELFRVFLCCRYCVTGSSRVECDAAVFHFVSYLYVFLNQLLFFSTGSGNTEFGASDNTVRIWDVSTQQQVAELRGHTSAVTSVAFDGSGKYLASGEVAEG